MGFFLSFVMGAATGAMVTWQIDRRRKRHKEARLNGLLSRTEVELRQLREAQETAAAIMTPAAQAEQKIVADDLSSVILLDRLEHIHGLTPIVARRLNQAGILTYADLARQLPERLRALVVSDENEDMSVHDWPVHDWIDHARSLAHEDDVI